MTDEFTSNILLLNSLHLFTGDLEVQNLKLFLETFTSCKKLTVGLFVCPGKILSESIFHFLLLHVGMQKNLSPVAEKQSFQKL